MKRTAIFRCSCKKRGSISIRKGTLLEQAKISFRRFILLFYTFLQSFTYAQGILYCHSYILIDFCSFTVRREVSLTESEDEGDSDDPITEANNTLSTQTICNYYKYFKEAIGISD